MFDAERVEAVAQAAMERILLPPRKNLGAIGSHEKIPGELVASVDTESQKFICEQLRAVCPEAQFLGEELQGENPLDLNALSQYDCLWIVDPLDGTSVYASGGLSFSVMIAFAVRGIVQAGWIACPKPAENGSIGVSLACAIKGQPALLDGREISVVEDSPGKREGIIRTKYFSEEIRESLASLAHVSQACKGQSSAGVDMLALVGGGTDYLIYSRTLPWEFSAPLYWGGAAGVVARRFSGAPVDLKPGGTGLLCARSYAAWKQVHAETIAKISHAYDALEDISTDCSVRV